MSARRGSRFEALLIWFHGKPSGWWDLRKLCRWEIRWHQTHSASVTVVLDKNDMKSLEHLIGLLEARAAYYKWCADTSADYKEQDWTELRPLYSAQAEALESAVAEVRAAIVELRPPNSRPITCWLLATEMGGLLTANLFLDRESAIRAKDQFCERHFLESQAGTPDGASAPHAQCEIREFTLLPRQDLNPGDLDGRYVVMSCFKEPNAIRVLETKEDAEAEVARLKKWFGDEAWVSYHPILIPQNSTQFDQGSSTYH